MTRLETREDGLWLVAPWDEDGIGKKVIKGWESYTGWYWFATEIEDEIGPEGKPRYFGFVQGQYPEWGSFSQAELDSVGHMVWAIKPGDLPHSGRRDRKAKPSKRAAAKRTGSQLHYSAAGGWDWPANARRNPAGVRLNRTRTQGYLNFRKFGVRDYYFTQAYESKADAKRRAATIRYGGHGVARVVPVKGRWVVYSAVGDRRSKWS